MLSQKRCARCAPFTPRHDRLGGGVGLFGTRTNAVGLQTCPVSTCTNAVGLRTCPVGTCTNAVGLKTHPASTCTNTVGPRTCHVSTCTNAVGLQTCPVSTCTNAVGLQTCPVGTCPHAVGLCTDRPGLRLFRPRGLQAYRLIGPLAWVPRPKRRRCGALPGAAPGRPGPVGRWVHLGLGGLGGRRPTN